MSFISNGVPKQDMSYLFIDGAYLRNVIERFQTEVYAGITVPIDYRRVAGAHTKVFYYDCPPAKRQGESDNEFNARERMQQTLYQALRSHRGWHIYEGVVKRTGKRARQKEVDILIAVDMLTHAYRRNTTRITFIAGDQDFRPLVDALVRDGVFVELVYDPASISSDLADAADQRTPLDPYWMFEWLVEDFKKTHPLPDRSGGSAKQPPANEPVETGQMEWCQAELYSHDGYYTIIHPYRNEPELYLRMRHSDLRLLKVVHAMTYGQCAWQGGAEPLGRGEAQRQGNCK